MGRVVSARVVPVVQQPQAERGDRGVDPEGRVAEVLVLAEVAAAASAAAVAELVVVDSAAAVAASDSAERADRAAREAIDAAISMRLEDRGLSSAIEPIADVKEFTAWPS